MIKQLIPTTMIASTLALATVGVATVSADAPTTIEDSATFTDINPCTDEEFEVTIDVVVRVHEHRNNVVLTVDRTGTTSDGFVMRHGPEVEHRNFVNGVLGYHFKDFWTNDETGQRFHVRGHGNMLFGDGFDAPPTDVKVDTFSLRCVK